MLSAGDSQRVAELMRETAAAELLPRFRNLAKETSAEAAGRRRHRGRCRLEQRLAVGLAKILPGVPVVGEEAVERIPACRPDRAAGRELLDRRSARRHLQLRRRARPLRHDRLPGARSTRRSAAGSSTCRTTGMAMALKGQGVTLDGARSIGKAEPAAQGLIGYKVRKEFDRQLAPPATAAGRLTTLNCAGREYIEILAGASTSTSTA
jgi:hypothetical protein